MEPLILTHCGTGSPVEWKDAAEKAGRAGLEILEKGGSALDAVEVATVVLENDERLNAGIGSRHQLDGVIRMDASIMDSLFNCGAVASIERVKNPIKVARKVMETPHILLVGEGALEFARKLGFEDFDPATDRSRKRLEKEKHQLKTGDIPEWARGWKRFEWKETVGAVARDSNGLMAAASSTGGTSFMLKGRVGDTPIIGAGIYAGEKGAVTATGVGEEIVRKVLCKYVYDRIEDGMDAQEACDKGVGLYDKEISVGLIAVTPKGWGISSNRNMAWWCSEGDHRHI